MHKGLRKKVNIKRQSPPHRRRLPILPNCETARRWPRSSLPAPSREGVLESPMLRPSRQPTRPDSRQASQLLIGAGFALRKHPPPSPPGWRRQTPPTTGMSQWSLQWPACQHSEQSAGQCENSRSPYLRKVLLATSSKHSPA